MRALANTGHVLPIRKVCILVAVLQTQLGPGLYATAPSAACCIAFEASMESACSCSYNAQLRHIASNKRKGWAARAAGDSPGMLKATKVQMHLALQMSL